MRGLRWYHTLLVFHMIDFWASSWPAFLAKVHELIKCHVSDQMLLRLLLLLLFAFFVLLRSQVQASNFCGFIHLMGDGYLKLAISMETLMINPGIWFFWGVPVIFSLEIGPWFNRWGRSKPSCASCHLMELAARDSMDVDLNDLSGDLRSNSGNLTNTGGALLATKKVHHYYFFLSRRLERSNWS